MECKHALLALSHVPNAKCSSILAQTWNWPSVVILLLAQFTGCDKKNIRKVSVDAVATQLSK